ncbi:uncharacterized protein LOC119085595 [Bradysia coprophila]|uniref:uncharacterized protein LOC119085595 n=1 Tax=Bradysia coprophila TaxID=38358 RepID=UPI00187D71DE|nr:uncharacterized protein LOC119085595 [Bradysia coprophila]
MSYSVNITTRTTSSSNAIFLNYGYCKTIPGLLKLSELILGIITVGVTVHYYTHNLNIISGDLFFLLMATTFMVGTFCLLFSYVLSWKTAVIPKTMFEIVYHGIAFILLLAASITLLVKVKDLHWFRRDVYDAYMASAILGLINSVLYLASTVFAQRQYQGI